MPFFYLFFLLLLFSIGTLLPLPIYFSFSFLFNIFLFLVFAFTEMVEVEEGGEKKASKRVVATWHPYGTALDGPYIYIITPLYFPFLSQNFFHSISVFCLSLLLSFYIYFPFLLTSLFPTLVYLPTYSAFPPLFILCFLYLSFFFLSLSFSFFPSTASFLFFLPCILPSFYPFFFSSFLPSFLFTHFPKSLFFSF